MNFIHPRSFHKKKSHSKYGTALSLINPTRLNLYSLFFLALVLFAGFARTSHGICFRNRGNYAVKYIAVNGGFKVSIKSVQPFLPRFGSVCGFCANEPRYLFQK